MFRQIPPVKIIQEYVDEIEGLYHLIVNGDYSALRNKSPY